MAAGGSFNAIFDYFKHNSENSIILPIDVSVRDDSAKIVDTYKAYGTTPRFPIVLATGNAKEVSTIYGAPGTGGPTYILHPDREIQNTSYGEVTMRLDLEKAQDDDCEDGGISTIHFQHYSKDECFSLDKGVLSIFPAEQGPLTLSLFNSKGQELCTRFIVSTAGQPYTMNLRTFGEALLLLQIRGSGGTEIFKVTP